MTTEVQENRQRNPLVVFKNDLEERDSNYAELLEGTGITTQAFRSAAMTGVHKNPELLTADKFSLFDSLSQACRDGLLPDGRQGALVIHPTKVSKRGEPDRWVNNVAWMPMVRGVMSKIRMAPGVTNIVVDVVYRADRFQYWVDEEGQHLKHAPDWASEKHDHDIIAAYAMVRFDSGEQQVEVVGRVDLDKIKAASKTGKKNYGPWAQWYAQMAKKSAIHRLAPKLPLPDAVMNVINRDEQLYDFDQKQETRDVTPRQPGPNGRPSRLHGIIQQNTDQQQESEPDENA